MQPTGVVASDGVSNVRHRRPGTLNLGHDAARLRRAQPRFAVALN
jgi:hypothetical protein